MYIVDTSTGKSKTCQKTIKPLYIGKFKCFTVLSRKLLYSSSHKVLNTNNGLCNKDSPFNGMWIYLCFAFSALHTPILIKQCHAQRKFMITCAQYVCCMENCPVHGLMYRRKKKNTCKRPITMLCQYLQKEKDSNSQLWLHVQSLCYLENCLLTLVLSSGQEKDHVKHLWQI